MSSSYVDVGQAQPTTTRWWSSKQSNYGDVVETTTQGHRFSCLKLSNYCPSGTSAANMLAAAILITIAVVSIAAIADHLPADLTATYATTALAVVGLSYLIAHLVKQGAQEPLLS